MDSDGPRRPAAVFSGPSGWVPATSAGRPQLDGGRSTLAPPPPRQGHGAWGRLEARLGLAHPDAAPRPAAARRTEAAALPRPADVVGDYVVSPSYGGGLDGFHFTTRKGHTGYYRSTGAVTALCLAEALEAPSRQPAPIAGGLARQRASGARRPPPAPAAVGPGAPRIVSEALADDGWKAVGLWAVDSVSGNSWASLDSLVLSESAADLVLIQEHKVASIEATQVTAARGRARGWRCSASVAHRTAAGRGSEGGAAWRRASARGGPG